VDAPGGKKHRFYYFERKDGYRFWLRAHADYWAREYLEDKARDLGDLYFLTKEDRYARRVALILNRFAEVYPGYVYRFDYPFRQKLFAPYAQSRVPGVPGDYRTARWTWWAYMDISLDLLRAYDGLQDWPGWKTFADGNTRQRIEKDFFEPMVEFVLGFKDDATNMSMGMWRSAIYAGRVWSHPQWVHEAVRRYERLLETRFLYDGHWMETADSYAEQTQGGLQVVMEAADGYSDPPGYANPVDGRRFDDLSLRRLTSGYNIAEQLIGAVRFPDSRLLPVNDTWSVDGKTQYWRQSGDKPRDRMEPVLLPATGLAVLGGGEGEHQIHAYLDYTMGAHHKHYDALSIGLWANGRELLSDIGYTWTNYRLHWATSTMAHNAVVVDGGNSGLDRMHTGHRLRTFVVDPEGLQLASVAAAPTAYPGIATRYRRTLALVGTDSRDAYLIDIFQVDGGSRHDYLLHGCRDADTDASATGVDLKPFEGTLLNNGIEFSLPQSFQHPNPSGFGFGFIRNLRSGNVSGNLTLDFRLRAQPESGTRTLVTGVEPATLFVGDAPDVRRAKEINGNLEKSTAPLFCLQRRGEHLQSIFIATHEPVNGKPKIKRIDAQQSNGVLLLKVDRGATDADSASPIDWFAMALDEPTTASFSTSNGPLQFGGDYGMVRTDAAKNVLNAWLVAGTKLSFGGKTLTGRCGWSGQVLRHGNDSLHTGAQGYFDIDQNVEQKQVGLFMLRFADGTFWPFNVVAIERLPQGSRVHVREKPAFQIGDGKTRLLAFPQREIDGDKLAFDMTEVVRLHRSQ